MSLRLKLLSVVATISALMIGVASFLAFDAWKARQNIQYVFAETTKSDKYLGASLAYLNERDGASFAMATVEKINASDLSELSRSADQQANNLVAALKSAGATDVAEEIAGDITELVEVRESIRNQYGTEISDRDPDVLKQWSKTVSHLVEEFETQRRQGSRGPSALDPVVGQYSEVRHTALMSKHLIGLEALLLATLIRDELPLSPKNLKILADFRGRFDTLWSSLLHNAEILNNSELTTSVLAVRKIVEERYNVDRENVIKSASAGDDILLSLDAWNDVAQSSNNALAAVIDVATRMNSGHLASSVTQSTVKLVISGALIFFSLLLVVGSFFVVTSGVMNPLHQMTSTMRHLAEGDTTAEIEGDDRTDEIGEMARMVVIFRDNAIERETLRSTQDADAILREERQRKTEALIDGFRAEIRDLLVVVGSNMEQMKTTAGILSGVADETGGRASGAAAASEEASANVQTVAASAEELSASIVDISQQVTTTTEIVSNATEATRKANTQISGLAEAARKIDEIVALIQGIAEQTNLLALNATIEAARAGESGKGFAVVASEVKALANQTAQATAEIAQQISMIQSSTDEAVHSVQGIATTMQDADGYTASIAAAIEQQGAATVEISRNVQQAAQRTQDVSENMSGVSSGVAETTQSAIQMQQSATDVSEQTDRLRKSVDMFLDEVAAA